MTVQDGFASIAASDLAESSVMMAAPNAIVHISSSLTQDSQRYLEDIPLPIFCQADASDLSVRVQLVFDESMMDHFHALTNGEHFLELVRSVWETDITNPLAQLSQISVKDKTFIRYLNSTPQKLDHRTILDCIAQNSKRDPEHPAIEAWDGVLSRKQLEEHSNRLAKTLNSAGVKRGCVVWIFMDKSVWVPVALIATLKAGGAFLIMESTLPFERLKIMTERTKISHAITSREHMALGCSLVSIVISGDTYGEFVVADRGINRSYPDEVFDSVQVSPEDSAFLIFTSGSSGIPKAIVTQHFAWVTGYTDHIHMFGITEGKRVFQYASYSFVVSILDTISTLMVGGVVCIPSPDERTNNLENAIRRMRAEYICMTPSVAKLLTPSHVPSLETLVLVGEPIPRSLSETWLKAGTVTVRNGYGQSEACSMNSTAILSQSVRS
jgi:acyl-coenzyme A synthetase/AMP-(fatty) acid ligase